MEKSLGDVLSSILETELKIAFGDLWIEVNIFTIQKKYMSIQGTHV